MIRGLTWGEEVGDLCLFVLYDSSVAVQSLSQVRLFATPWTAARQASFNISLAQTHVHWVSDAIQPSHPLSSPTPPAFDLSQHQNWMSPFFSSGGQSIGASASASVFPMNIQLISFRIDWFDLLAVQGTLKSHHQHHSSTASVLQRSTFFVVLLSHPSMTTGKTIALTRQTSVGKVMSLF